MTAVALVMAAYFVALLVIFWGVYAGWFAPRVVEIGGADGLTLRLSTGQTITLPARGKIFRVGDRLELRRP